MKFKSQLTQLAPEELPLGACPISTTPYSIASEEGSGLVFKKMAAEQSLMQASYIKLSENEQLDHDLFDQV